MASASALTPAQVPIALPRSAGGNALAMIESVAGIMNAAPMPWTARPATSQVSLWREADEARWTAPNVTTPKRKTRRRPKMSPRRPPVTSRTAKASV